nr:hypothetical protein OG409_03400 [Streptomyces sp. NBC_00974]
MREDATGDRPLRHPGAKGADGKLVPASGGSVRTKTASGFGRTDYPVIGSTGGLAGDGVTDLRAVAADGRTVLFRGAATGVDSTPVVPC